jgi:glucokinase
VDLGGTAINYTLVNGQEQFLIEGLCEHPALSKQGPQVCLQQIEEGLKIAVEKAGIRLSEVVAVGLDTPGPASATGVLSARGSTNFVHADWAGFDIPRNLAKKLGKPVNYLNDGNAGALWGHFTIFGAHSRATSITTVIGTGLGGGVIMEGNVLKGRKGFGGELGHVLIPYQAIAGIQGLVTDGRSGGPLFPHRDRKDASSVFPAAVSGPRTGKIGRPPQGSEAGARLGRGRRSPVYRDLPRAGPRHGPVLR